MGTVTESSHTENRKPSFLERHSKLGIATRLAFCGLLIPGYVYGLRYFNETFPLSIPVHEVLDVSPAGVLIMWFLGSIRSFPATPRHWALAIVMAAAMFASIALGSWLARLFLVLTGLFEAGDLAAGVTEAICMIALWLPVAISFGRVLSKLGVAPFERYQ